MSAFLSDLKLIHVMGGAFILAVLIQGGIFFCLHWRRKKRGLKFPRKKDDGVLFYERFASGSSYRSWITRMGGAHNCLTVIVTESHLHLTSFFPFSLILHSYDLEHSIRREDILDVSPEGVHSIVTFKRANGREGKIKITLRKDRAFLDTLNARKITPPPLEA